MCKIISTRDIAYAIADNANVSVSRLSGFDIVNGFNVFGQRDLIAVDDQATSLVATDDQASKFDLLCDLLADDDQADDVDALADLVDLFD